MICLIYSVMAFSDCVLTFFRLFFIFPLVFHRDSSSKASLFGTKKKLASGSYPFPSTRSYVLQLRTGA